ncbi:MAG: hypothetical protein EOM28_10615 [Clostridia bacterium]|nr:hypothetical protein [Clostridia bacterium]
MYKNTAGYADPTAGEAMSRVMREYKKKQREIWKKQYELKNRPKVYVVSKYAGDVKNNVADAITYCRFVIEKGKIPVASHLLYPRMLDDSNPTERELGTMFGLALLAMCDEVWVFGKERSSGMEQEIKEAKKLGKKVRYVKEVS